MLQNKLTPNWKLLVAWGFGFNIGLILGQFVRYLRPSEPVILYKPFDIEEGMFEEIDIDKIITSFEKSINEVELEDRTILPEILDET